MRLLCGAEGLSLHKINCRLLGVIVFSVVVTGVGHVWIQDIDVGEVVVLIAGEAGLCSRPGCCTNKRFFYV